MVESKIKLKNQYTSAILKYKLKGKIQLNKQVQALTHNNVPNVEKLADDIRKTKSFEFIDQEHMQPTKPPVKEYNKFKTAVISPGF